MSENIETTAETVKARKRSTLNRIFDVLIETTGIHGGKESKFLDYHRGEFLSIQLRDEYSYSHEYWFPSNASANMKLLYSNRTGFSVITQDHTVKGKEAAKQANARLVELGYAI